MIDPVDEAPAPQTTGAPGGDQTGNANNRLDRDMVKWTKAVALLTGALVFVGICQIGAGLLQWSEMKSSGIQTEQIITAYDKIAKASADSVVVSNNLVVATADAVKASNRLAGAAETANSETEKLVAAATDANDESRRLADAATKANEVTRRLADAAVQGNKISQESLINVQRPFMFVHGLNTENSMLSIPMQQSLPTGWRANIEWENSGNTQTKDLTITTHCLASLNSLSDPFALLVTEPHSPMMQNIVFPAVFGPKQVANGGVCSISLMATALEHMLGIGHYYAFGNARYHDRFSGEKSYRTDFCFELTVTGGDIEKEFNGNKNPGPATVVFHHCWVHNCADEECEKEDHATAQRAIVSPPDLGFGADPKFHEPRPTK